MMSFLKFSGFRVGAIMIFAAAGIACAVEPSTQPAASCVYILGEVQRPGVYELQDAAPRLHTVRELFLAAGILKGNDEMVVRLVRRGNAGKEFIQELHLDNAFKNPDWKLELTANDALNVTRPASNQS